MERKTLLEALDSVHPALSSVDIVPALKNYCFDGDTVTAYDDIMAIQAFDDFGVTGGVPGDPMNRLIKSLGTRNVGLAVKSGNMIVTAGKGRTFKLPCLPKSSFLFKRPAINGASLDVSPDLLDGIAKVVGTIGDIATFAATLGVTLVWSEEGLRWYSTDNVSVSEFLYKGAFKRFKPISIPSAFIRQMRNFGGGKMTVGSKYVCMETDGLYAYSKLPVTNVKADTFEGIVEGLGKAKKVGEIDAAMRGAAERAVIMLGSDASVRTELVFEEAGKGSAMNFRTAGSHGMARERVVVPTRIEGAYRVHTSAFAKGCTCGAEDLYMYGSKNLGFVARTKMSSYRMMIGMMSGEESEGE